MNDFYSSPVEYLQRWLTPQLQLASQAHPIVVLTGARQVGKSTLLTQAEPFRNWSFRTLDDLDFLAQALERPEGLWAGTDRVIIDEVQRHPALLLAIKRAVDQAPRRMRFVLSGSTNLLLMKQVSESLAGRAVYLTLNPLTLGEVRQTAQPTVLTDWLLGRWPAEGETAGGLELDPTAILVRGLMPPLLHLPKPADWARWWQGYVSTYLERDLRQIAQIDALLDFRRVMELAALRTGQLINQSEIARDARLSQPTVHRYLNLLETTHLFERLPAYTTSRSARLIKAPKAYWADPALAVFLAGYHAQADLRASRELGHFFESLVYHHLRVAAQSLTPSARLLFWRTQAGTGAEVDFVVEHGRKTLALEVKLTDSPSYRDTEGLRRFLDQHARGVGGVLLHCGQEVKQFGDNLVAIPWRFLTG